MSAPGHVSSVTFVHLRLHSEYSIVDGMVRLDEAVAAAAADRMPALALTDLSNVFGMVKFYKATRATGTMPSATRRIAFSCCANRARVTSSLPIG